MGYQTRYRPSPFGNTILLMCRLAFPGVLASIYPSLGLADRAFLVCFL